MLPCGFDPGAPGLVPFSDFMKMGLKLLPAEQQQFDFYAELIIINFIFGICPKKLYSLEPILKLLLLYTLNNGRTDPMDKKTHFSMKTERWVLLIICGRIRDGQPADTGGVWLNIFFRQ